VSTRLRGGLHAFAPAKVNLTLAVLGRRSDGFHDLESVFARIGLYDEVVVEPLTDWERSSGSEELIIEPLDPAEAARHGSARAAHTPTGDDLILQAAAALRHQAPPSLALKRLRFRLTKRIPVAAGLGGGSSDAAAALLLAALAWKLEMEHDRLMTVAERLGSDVPFFASALRLALVRGRGESISSLGTPAGPLGVVTVTPGHRLSTPQVFSQLGLSRTREASHAREATRKLADLIAMGAAPSAIVAMAPELRDANDLWPAAIKVLPSLAWARDDLERAMGVPVLMSGSGPTLVALYPSPAQARAAADRLAGSLPPSISGAAVHAADLPAAH
jgi:4-diphosphocytidyl-2-C-methyl-D-erythritol kinase